MGPPGKAVRLTGRTCSYGWEGQLAVVGGEAREAPKPNERGHHKETETAARGYSER